MRALVTGSLAILGLIGCGDDGGKTATPDAADNGFAPPDKVMHANDETGAGVWMDLGPADLTCLNTPNADVATPAGGTTLNTVVKDFQSDKEVHDAMVTAFDGVNVNSPFGAATTSDAMGKVTVAIPAGIKRFGFKMVGGAQGADTQLDTFLLNQTFETSAAEQTSPELLSVSNSTAQLLPALIGEPRTAGTGVLAGALRDCAGHEMSNFVAAVSSTQGTATLIPGAATYYFSATSQPLPQKHGKVPYGSSNGLYMIIQIPATENAYVQMWGFKSDADLASGNMSLVAELKVPVVADSVVTGSYAPLRQ